MGSSRRSAGVSGTPSPSPPEDGIESSFCKVAMERSGSPMRAVTRARTSIGDGTSQGVLLDRIRGDGPFRQSQSGGLVTETHTGQREVANEAIIVRLFFEERFQFAARLSPGFLGSGIIAADFLCPTQPKAQLPIVKTQRRIRLCQYFLQARNDLRRPALQNRLVNSCFQLVGYRPRSGAEQGSPRHAASRPPLVR